MVTNASYVYDVLDKENVHNALIFIDKIVPDNSKTYVFFPKNSGPDHVAEDRIFFRWPDSLTRLNQAIDAYSGRAVWGVGFTPDKKLIIAKQGTGEWISLLGIVKKGILNKP